MPRYSSLGDPETLRMFVRNLREGIYISNPEGDLLDGNPALLDIFGVESLEQLRSYTAPELFVDPRQRQEEMALLAREGTVREFEIHVKRADGEVRTLLDTCYQVVDPDTGRVTNHGILVDITGRKQLEEELREY